MAWWNGEYGLDRALVGAGTDERLVGTVAKNQIERTNNNGFARTGFAGDDVQTATELNGDILNDGDVTNAKRLEH